MHSARLLAFRKATIKPALCEQLNAKATHFPGTALRLHFAVEPQSPVI